MWPVPLCILAIIVSAPFVSTESAHKRYISIPIGVRRGGEKIQRDVTNDGLVRRSTSSSVKVVAEPAFYYIEIEVGTPAQTIKVDLDTGSSDLGIQLDTCVQLSDQRDCDPSDFVLNEPGVGSCAGGSYSPSASSTSHMIMCDHHPEISCACLNQETSNCYGLNCYGDGSGFTSKLILDNVSIASFKAEVMFAGVLEEYQDFLPDGEADGILGLGYRRETTYNETPALPAIVAANNLSDVFGLDLCQHAGTFTIGTSPSSEYMRTPILYEAYYSVDLQKIDFYDGSTSDKSIAVNSTTALNIGTDFGTIIDSGTTLIVLRKSLFDTWQDSFVPHYCQSYDKSSGCCTLENSDAQIGFTFANSAGGSFTVRKNFQDISSPCGGGVNSFSPNVVSSDAEHGNILGDAFMQGLSILFDRGQKEVAMKVITCPSTADGQWVYLVVATVVFFLLFVCIIAVSVGIYEWRVSRRCCCRRFQNLDDDSAFPITNSPDPEFAKVQATLAPFDGDYGAMDKIEYPEPIDDSDADSTSST